MPNDRVVLSVREVTEEHANLLPGHQHGDIVGHDPAGAPTGPVTPVVTSASH